jgi:hypothetical protein
MEQETFILGGGRNRDVMANVEKHPRRHSFDVRFSL